MAGRAAPPRLARARRAGSASTVAADLGPYAPRQHPGLGGWDFLSGALQARGTVDDLPLLDRVRAAGPRTPGALTAELRVERGRLLPGSPCASTLPAAVPAPP